jgi:DNA-binding Lrp family transcriptional regulator
MKRLGFENKVGTMEKLDRIDWEIIALLNEDGRMNFSR